MDISAPLEPLPPTMRISLCFPPSQRPALTCRRKRTLVPDSCSAMAWPRTTLPPEIAARNKAPYPRNACILPISSRIHKRYRHPLCLSLLEFIPFRKPMNSSVLALLLHCLQSQVATHCNAPPALSQTRARRPACMHSSVVGSHYQTRAAAAVCRGVRVECTKTCSVPLRHQPI